MNERMLLTVHRKCKVKNILVDEKLKKLFVNRDENGNICINNEETSDTILTTTQNDNDISMFFDEIN